MTGSIIPGASFGKWTVLERAERADFWVCRCECGTVRDVLCHNLRRGQSRSCGCVQRRHGGHGSPEYVVWRGMRKRCEDPSNRAYADYGGRGVTVCERWSDFAAFIADMGPRPSAAHSIERVDNDRGYEPTNCVWATRREQARNRRSSHRLELDGETLTIADWSERTGLDFATISYRLRRGWSVRDALTRKPDRGSGRRRVAGA